MKSVDVISLLDQCHRWSVTPHPSSMLMSAHWLLARMPTDPRINLQWATGDLWQLSISGKLIQAGSFEDCVTALAQRYSP